MKWLLTIALLMTAAPAFAQEPEPAATPEDKKDEKSGTRTDFEASYARFSSYFDGTKRRSLDRAYSQPNEAKGVTLDALVLSFDGRYDLGGGVDAGLAFPLVRASRSGRRELLVSNESLFAESIAIGDLVADVGWTSGGKPLGFGAKAFLHIPTGGWEDLDASQMPTGGGAWGIGVEGKVAAQPVPMFAAGASLGAAMRMERKDGLDRGDPIWARAWGAMRFGDRISAGAALGFFMHGGDTVDGAKVTALPPDLVFGAPSPAQQLVSLAPFVELQPSATTRVTIALADPGTGTLFFPVETGFALSGKNVLAGELMLRVAVSARF